MSEGTSVWDKPLKAIDGALRNASKKAKKIIRVLRLVRFGLLLLFLLPLVMTGLTIWKPVVFFPYAMSIIALYVAVPLLALWFVVGLPLRAKSIVRLVDQGYPANVKELGLRIVARKLHDQSIQTEELLLDTAVNESKKLMRKYKARAERLKEELDKEPTPAPDSEE